MANYKQIFMDYLDSKNVIYTDYSENVVKVSYAGDNLKSIPVYVMFDQDGDAMVQLRCWEIANFKDKMAPGLIACNDLNGRFRWVKFYIDSDSDVVCECDAVIDENTCGSECLSLVGRIVTIADSAYPDLMRALYN